MKKKGRERQKPQTKKHWYFVTIFYCPLCGKSKQYRERRPGTRPRAESKCRRVIEDWDGCGI